jgi:murein DD-endopeptidase MepM/ murein hydrolase activator NlpD
MAGSLQPMGRLLTPRAFAVFGLLIALSLPASAMTREPRSSAEVPPPRPAPRLIGYRIPVDAPLVLAPALLPGASRAYRAGIHEGLDIAAPLGATVRAAREGTIVRIDTEYAEWSPGERVAALAASIRSGATAPEVLDRIRGRQVWIDHGDGVLTRYAHLAGVADLRAGDRVEAGQAIGTVGASGLPEGGPHLHFEIRVGDSYLGAELAAEEVRYLFARAFSPQRVGRECDR